MPYSKTPTGDTYSTKRIKLTKESNVRGNNPLDDDDYFNIFFEVKKNKTTGESESYAVKRAGAEVFATLTAEPRLLFFWEDRHKLYVFVGTDVMIYDSITGVNEATLATGFTTSAGKVGCTEFSYDTDTVGLVATDGTTLITIAADNTIAKSESPNIPVPHAPNPIFLDGYVFVAKAGSADIYNSDLNDPLTWTEGNFISAEMSPDLVVGITKVNNYLVVLGSSSLEYFWDAAILDGSPLQRNDSPYKNIGYLGGLAKLGNKVFIVANMTESSPSVYLLEDFKAKKVSTESVERYLALLKVNFSDYQGSVLSYAGHDFYVLNAGHFTYVMEIETELWTRWAWQNSTSYPITYAINAKNPGGYEVFFTKAYENNLYKLSPDYYLDAGILFACIVTTDNQMFDSYNQKYISRLSVICDRPRGVSNLGISWSDDDYQTFTTPVQTNLNQDIPSIKRLGKFRRRAFRLTYIDNYPMRLMGLEVDINLGSI